MHSTVYITNPTRFDMCGQRLAPTLKETDHAISAGLVKRLHRYAMKRLDERGFAAVVSSWVVDVYTMDGDKPAANRTYCVRFVNPKKGFIEVIGIHTQSGWPSLDFGLDIGEE